MLLKTVLITICATLLLATVGCAGPPEIQEVEVTREVPVTVETVKNMPVTREVPVTQEVPVTVVVSETVEVTREVPVPQTVVVTREVPVTQAAIATPTPAIAAAPTISPADAPTATPEHVPTPTPTAAPTPTLKPSETSRFHPWRMERKQYAQLDKYSFRIDALEYEAMERPPTLTYECDHRGRRTMYINWHHPITAASSERPSASPDPFSQYRDIPYYSLLEYIDGLLPFVDELRLTPREQDDLEEIWDEVEDRWFVGTGSSSLDGEPTPQVLVDLLRSRTHRSVRISLAFYVETINPDKPPKYGPPSLADIGGEWLVLSDRTEINPGSLGELRMAIREVFAQPFEVGAKRPVLTATITSPGQPVHTVAKWNITGIRLVMSHCQAVRL